MFHLCGHILSGAWATRFCSSYAINAGHDLVVPVTRCVVYRPSPGMNRLNSYVDINVVHVEY